MLVLGSVCLCLPRPPPNPKIEHVRARFWGSDYSLAAMSPLILWSQWPQNKHLCSFQGSVYPTPAADCPLAAATNPDTKNMASWAVFSVSGFFCYSKHKKCHQNSCIFRASLFFPPPPGLLQIWTQKLQPNWVWFSCLDFSMPLPCTCLLVTRLGSSCFIWYNALFGEFSNMIWNHWSWLKTTEIALIALDSVPN